MSEHETNIKQQNEKTPESLKNDQEGQSELKQNGIIRHRHSDATENFEGLEITRTAFGRTITHRPAILQ